MDYDKETNRRLANYSLISVAAAAVTMGVLLLFMRLGVSFLYTAVIACIMQFWAGHCSGRCAEIIHRFNAGKK